MNVRQYWEYGLLPFSTQNRASLGKVVPPKHMLLWLQFKKLLYLHCFSCMQRGKTQTSSSHSSLTLLPCNFSVECPTHPPHITALPLTPPTPWKTSHASTYTATWPKYTAPLSLLLSACSDTQYALTATGFPPCHEQCACFCVRKYFACAPDSISFFPLAAEKHQSFLWLLQLAFQFVGHKCQGGQWCGWIQRKCLRRGGSKERRPWGHCLEIRYQHRARPCQHQLTLSYEDTQTAGRLC